METSIIIISVVVAILILMVLLILYTLCLFWAFRGGIDLPQLNEDPDTRKKPVRLIFKNPFKGESMIEKPYTKYCSDEPSIIKKPYTKYNSDNDLLDIDTEEINPKLREMFQNVDSSPT